MYLLRLKIVAALCVSFFLHAVICAADIENDKYVLSLTGKKSAKLSLIYPDAKGKIAREISPEFVVMYSAKNPGINVNHSNYYIAPRTAVRWSNYEEPLDVVNANLKKDEVVAGMGANGKVVEENGGRKYIYTEMKTDKVKYTVSGNYAKGTTNPFAAGELVKPRIKSAIQKGRCIEWLFEPNENFDLKVSLFLPEGDEDLQISYELNVKKGGYYSVGFCGIEGVEWKKIKWTPQEVFGRNYKQYNHLVPESMLKLPKAQITTGNFSMALVVDAEEMPFRLPNKSNALFGLMTYCKDGHLSPASFAPIMGGANSKKSKGDKLSFKLHFALSDSSDWRDMYRYAAEKFYNFRDMRDNSGAGPINNAIHNTIEYLADRDGNNYAMWHAEQKYYDYWCDNSGIFKPFSLLYGLSAAVIADDLDFFKKRAHPHTEFTLSRKNSIFAPYEVEFNNQVKSRNRGLGESYCSASELLSIASFYQNKSPYINSQIEKKGFNEKDYSDLLAKFEITKDKSIIEALVKIIIARNKSHKAIRHVDYQGLLDVYDASKNPEILEFAKIGAYSQTTLMNLSPLVPESEMLADENGSGVHAHSFGRHIAWGFPKPLPYPLEARMVPAWRLALTGLESPAYRGEYWMHHHGHLMRIGSLCNDEFLKNIARWGMVGRFGMYPGDNRSNYSLMPEQPDAVNHPMWELTFSTVNPGHAWEFVGELLDFLISDAFDRSRHNIDFPSRPMTATAFKVRVYGDRPGKFYDTNNARLWMPKGLLKIDNKQLDYVSAYDGDNFYIAFINQSFADEKFAVSFNRARVVLGENAKDLEGGGVFEIQDNTLKLNVKAKGILALKIPASQIKTSLQAMLFDNSAPLGGNSFKETDAPFGKVHSYILKIGDALSYAHVYTDALPDATISTKLKWRIDGGEWNEAVDAIFPYEYTIELPAEAKKLEYVFAHKNAAAKTLETPTITIEK